MSTSVEGRQGRPYEGGMFADITPVEVERFTAQGVLFDGTLTDTQVINVWWRWTTADDTAEANLREIAELRLTDTTASPLTQRIAAYLLGES